MTSSASPGRSDAAQAEAFRRWHEGGDRQAREQLICAFMPLARRLAARYRGPHEPFDDLVQVAMLGLIGAIDRFDPDRGSPFTAFAVPTILGELKRHFRNTGWAVHVPRRAQELSLRVAQAERELTARAGHRPSVAELALYLELDLESVLSGLETASAHHADSLDVPAGGLHEDREPEPLVATIGQVDEALGLVETRTALAAELVRLPHRERMALSLRMRDRLRQVEIAERLGCSQMQVSRLLARAMTRLRERGVIT